MALMKFLLKLDATLGPEGTWEVSDSLSSWTLEPSLLRCWLLSGSLPEDRWPLLLQPLHPPPTALPFHKPATLKTKVKTLRCPCLRLLREVQQKLSQAGS